MQCDVHVLDTQFQTKLTLPPSLPPSTPFPTEDVRILGYHCRGVGTGHFNRWHERKPTTDAHRSVGSSWVWPTAVQDVRRIFLRRDTALGCVDVACVVCACAPVCVSGWVRICICTRTSPPSSPQARKPASIAAIHIKQCHHHQQE